MEVVHHHIPIEIIRQILWKLEVKAVIRCECVCKEWRSIIQDPHFKLSYRGPERVIVVVHSRIRCLAVTSITNTTTPRIETLFLPNTTTSTWFYPLSRWWSGVWCSCNGLVLFSAEKHILLWNPSTRCCTKVLELQLLHNSRHYMVSGLCYVPSTGDYKVVLYLLYDTTSVLVASLKNKVWRKVLFPYNKESIRDCGVNFHNTLYWRVSDSWERRFTTWGWNKIVYFDPGSDEFKELPIPIPRGESSVIHGMGIIDDCLCVAIQRKEIRGLIQVLVMKEYGVEKSWVTKFNISATNFECEKFSCNYRNITLYSSEYGVEKSWVTKFNISATNFECENFSCNYRNITLYSSKCNAKVLICSSSSFNSWKILVYDLKNNTLKPFFTESIPYGGLVSICSYVQSIVSPHEFIWRDNDDQHNPPAKNDATLLSFILERFNM